MQKSMRIRKYFEKYNDRALIYIKITNKQTILEIRNMLVNGKVNFTIFFEDTFGKVSDEKKGKFFKSFKFIPQLIYK